MNEPTIDEAIECVKAWIPNELARRKKLAIKALEEMKGKDKPRTWRDVTAGEMWDTCNDEGSQGFIKGCAEGHLWFHSKPTIPASWTSMGA